MNRPSSFIASITLLAVAGAANAAVSPVGTWHGKMLVTFTPPPHPPAAQGQTQTTDDGSAVKKKVMEALSKVRIIVVIKKGGTYSATSINAAGITLKTTGKWTQKAHNLTLQPDPDKDPKSGKVTHKPPYVGVVSANGKKFVVPVPADVKAIGVQGKIVFTKG